MTTAVIVIGGAPPHPAAVARLPEDRYVIAADGGLDRALAAGVGVHELVGDLDSVTPAALDGARSAGIPIHQHPTDKDQTDLELAIDRARELGARRVLVLGGGGGRLDHEVATLVAVARSGAHAWIGPARVVGLLPGGTVRLTGRPGDYVSLLALNGDATGVTTCGLKFPLHDGTIPAASGLGVSNELLSVEAGVALGDGSLLVVQPDALGGEG